MSGIAGIMTHDGSEPSESLLIKMGDLIDYRGPFDTGIATQGNTGFIYKNLQSLALNNSHQPLSSETQLSLVFDGFIANYDKIYTGLDSKDGLDKATMAEILFPLYSEKGAEFAEHVDGMYGLALFDGYAEELVLARDLTGLKPLYYTWINNHFIFSSSLQSLMVLQANSETNDVKPNEAVTQQSHGQSIDLQSLRESLQYGATVGSRTLGETIFSVNPGETLIIHNAKIIKRFVRRCRVRESVKKAKQNHLRSYLNSYFTDVIANRLKSVGQAGLIVNHPFEYYLGTFTKDHFPMIEQRGIKVAGEQQIPSSSLRMDQDVYVDESKFWRTLPFVVAAMDEPCYQPNLVFDYLSVQAFPKTLKNVFSGVLTETLYGDLPSLAQAKRLELLGGSLAPKRGAFESMTDAPLFLARWRTDLIGEVDDMKARQKLSRIQKAQLIYVNGLFQKSHIRAHESIMSYQNLEPHYFTFESPLFEYVLSLPDSAKLYHGQKAPVFYDLLKQDLGIPNPTELFTYRQNTLNSWLQHKSSRLGTLVAHQAEIESLFPNDFVRAVFTCKTNHHIRCAWILLIYAMWHQKAILGIKPMADTLSFLSARS